MVQPWKFIDPDGTFELPDPHHTSYLYFPLVNEAGMMSVVTPSLHGDVKAGQHRFLTPPVSVEDLHNSRAGRNFWVYVQGVGAWSASGLAAAQAAHRFTGQEEEQVTLQAGFLWQRLTRSNPALGLRAEITNLVPPSGDQVELMRVDLTNISGYPLHLTPTAAIPLYARSADNLRDHRHVTSLLHRITCDTFGVRVQPTLTFDERGHHPNQMVYAVLGVEGDGTPPQGFFPLVEDFIGEGGSLDWPEAAVRPLDNCVPAESVFAGYEALGGIRFQECELAPGQTCTYTLILAILPGEWEAARLIAAYGGSENFDRWLAETKTHWQNRLANLAFQTGDRQFDLWLKWVSAQPTLRRLFGNSFLPYHDYGRGGRGWRDLWQDILALLFLERGEVAGLLYENFAGVRMDGSNATIIGRGPGEFKADRNNIPRVWMDHGAWPLLTTQLYLDQSGDLEFLLREQTYFKDHLVFRAQAIDSDWDPAQGTLQRTRAGEVYRGTVLEHLLVQHLSAFFNVGEHNHLRLEGADWNDGLDMAAQRGESVAFSALYAENLRRLAQLVQALERRGHSHIELPEELLLLLDSQPEPPDYGSVADKGRRLHAYFTAVSRPLSGKKARVRASDLAADLRLKSDWLAAHIREQEWITNQEGYGWFNGYYDNDGARLEGDHPAGVRMTLTGQVFALMSDAASETQAQEIQRAVEHYLFASEVGGYRLNTDFNEVLLNMGRCFGFAYGHKENGAMFSHMAVMYAYALYTRGYALQAYRTLELIYRQSVNFPASRMYPGIPEYFNPRGRGVYPYLTGSASWYLLTLLTQAYGVRGEAGDLLLNPKLVAGQFDAAGETSVRTVFAGRRLRVTFYNPDRLDYGGYRIAGVSLDGKDLPVERDLGTRISREILLDLAPDPEHQITVLLAAS